VSRRRHATTRIPEAARGRFANRTYRASYRTTPQRTATYRNVPQRTTTYHNVPQRITTTYHNPLNLWFPRGGKDLSSTQRSHAMFTFSTAPRDRRVCHQQLTSRFKTIDCLYRVGYVQCLQDRVPPNILSRQDSLCVISPCQRCHLPDLYQNADPSRGTQRIRQHG
jgi:hypothetical protein